MIKKLTIIATLLVTMAGCASTSSKNVKNGHTNNWLRAINLNYQYVDPCDGYRNRVQPHFEKSVRISNSTNGQSVSDIIMTYVSADIEYRKKEDEYMKTTYPKWVKVAYGKTSSKSYSVGHVGNPGRYDILGPTINNRGRAEYRDSTVYETLQTNILKSLIFNPQPGYLSMTLYRYKEFIPKPSYPVNHIAIAIGNHEEKSHSTSWTIFTTPRSYYRCPQEHPLWGTPKFDVMMNCVENKICSAQVITKIR